MSLLQTGCHHNGRDPGDSQASVGLCRPSRERDVPSEPGVRRRAHPAAASQHSTTHGAVRGVAQLGDSAETSPSAVRGSRPLQAGAHSPVQRRQRTYFKVADEYDPDASRLPACYYSEAKQT